MNKKFLFLVAFVAMSASQLNAGRDPKRISRTAAEAARVREEMQKNPKNFAPKQPTPEALAAAQALMNQPYGQIAVDENTKSPEQKKIKGKTLEEALKELQDATEKEKEKFPKGCKDRDRNLQKIATDYRDAEVALVKQYNK